MHLCQVQVVQVTVVVKASGLLCGVITQVLNLPHSPAVDWKLAQTLFPRLPGLLLLVFTLKKQWGEGGSDGTPLKLQVILSAFHNICIDPDPISSNESHLSNISLKIIFNYCVYVCICMYISVCVYMCVHVCGEYVYVCMYVYVCVHAYVYACVYTCGGQERLWLTWT